MAALDLPPFGRAETGKGKERQAKAAQTWLSLAVECVDLCPYLTRGDCQEQEAGVGLATVGTQRCAASAVGVGCGTAAAAMYLRSVRPSPYLAGGGLLGGRHGNCREGVEASRFFICR